MEYSSAYTQANNIPEPVSVSLFVEESSTARVERCGWNLSSEKDPPSISLSPTLAGKQAVSSGGGCILLVEDNAGDIVLVREALKTQSLDPRIIVMRDGELAIRFLDEVDKSKTPCVNLVILDLNLPRRPGSDVLRRIRQSPVCGNVTVMVLSSSEAEKDKREMAALGANRYVRKPSSLAELVQLGAVVKEMLGSGIPS